MNYVALLGEGIILWLVLAGGLFALIMIIGIVEDWINDCGKDDPDDNTDWPGP